MSDDDAIDALASRLAAAGTVLVLTGSGLSADSGVPTFRDAHTGIWARYRPEELATPEAFAADPVAVWRWYAMRRRQLRAIEPNAGHYALAELAEHLGDLRLVTQNVDDLHRRAGHRDVIEFHGDLATSVCHRAGHVVEVAEHGDQPPVCPQCGSLARPAVVWFGENIPPAALERATAAAAACDLFLAVGTSAVVYPAAGLADIARAGGAAIAEINPGDTALSAEVDLRIAARAADALPRLRDRMIGDRGK